jgi:hypothetical protein
MSGEQNEDLARPVHPCPNCPGITVLCECAPDRCGMFPGFTSAQIAAGLTVPACGETET